MYYLYLVVYNSVYKWIFDCDFKISVVMVKMYNQDMVDDNGISIWWLIGLGVLGMLIVVLLILWLVFFLKKWW